MHKNLHGIIVSTIPITPIRILLSHIKEESTDGILDNTDGLWEHYARWKKSVQKTYTDMTSFLRVVRIGKLSEAEIG